MINWTRKVLCLDWDKRSLRIVAARVGSGRMVLDGAHSHWLPDALDSDDPQAMGDFIQQMLRRHRLRSKLVLVDVPRERAVINHLALPPTPANEVTAAVRFQAMRELPFPLESAAADYVVTKRDEQGLIIEVLLAAVTIETLDRVRATCQAAGLTPARIGLRPYANLVSVQNLADFKEGRVLFVDVGPGATEIDVFRGDELVFSRSANVNVPQPVSDAAAREDSRVISLAEVADLDASDGAVEAAVDELLVEVTRTIQAYRATEAEAVIDRVVVAGGTGIEPQFADVLHQRMRYPVDLYDPTSRLREDPSEAGKLRSFSAALGLAWGLSREGLLALDFLNPKRPVSSRETLRRRLRAGVIAAAVVLAATAGGLGKWYWDLSAQRDELVKDNNKRRDELNKLIEVRQQIDRAQEWELEAVWPDELLTVTRAAIEPGKQMLAQAIELESSARNQRITLRNVLASDWQVPMDFVRNLSAQESGGVPLYEVTPRAWTQFRGGSDFKGKLDIEVELRQLVQQQEEIKQREKARQNRKKPT